MVEFISKSKQEINFSKPETSLKLYSLWIFEGVSIIILSLYYILDPPRSLKYYQLYSWISVFGTFLCFSFAIKTMKGPYRFFREPISFINKAYISGKSNYIAIIFYLGYSIFLFINILNLVKLINWFTSNNIYLRITQICLLIAGFGIVMNSSIPIDITRKGHLYAALLIVVGFIPVNIIFLLYMQLFGYTYLLLQLILSTQLLFSGLYIWGYFSHFRASLFQKFWFIFVTLSIWANIEFLIDKIGRI